jgi:Predicted ATPases of PP-loop superfamily
MKLSDNKQSDHWVSLFSGGKDSSWALYRALGDDRDVTHLLTVHPSEDSYMYHVPETGLAQLAAESAGIELIEIDPDDFDASSAVDASTQGDRELEPLENALAELDETLTGGITGVTAGAVESEFQTSRIRGMCDRLDIELFAPLWQRDPMTLGKNMIAAGFEIIIVQVAARGLDSSWLGRTLDTETLSELATLNDRYGVHVLGEGGEFETFVTDGPHLSRPIEIEYTTTWKGTHGYIDVTNATLGSK